ncbi:MAG: AAA family ATPase [Gammaproteobacteria bacterium]|nr:AAA family ATPase [Gammaproteobacteria bacterium]
MRECNNWLILLDTFFLNGDWLGIKQHLGKMEGKDKSNDDKNSNQCATQCQIDEEQLLTIYGKQVNKFESLIQDCPSNECYICCCLYRKEHIFKPNKRNRQLQDKILTFLQVREENFENPLPTTEVECEKYFVVRSYNSQSRKEIPAVCLRCAKDIGSKRIPVCSIENGMGLDKIPTEIVQLNMYEMMLIQLAKAFHSVIRLTPYRFRGNKGELVKAVKGTSIHFPLPIKDTLDYTESKLPSPQCLEILVDSLPSSKRVVWRQLVDIKKVKSALNWLKQNNELYKNVEIVCDESLFDGTVTEVEQHDATELTLKAEAKSLLTKVDIDAQNEQYTVQQVQTNQPKRDDIDLFQMKRVEAQAEKQTDPDLDHKCFPCLFPKGRYGARTLRCRSIRLCDYWKARLMHSDARFRRNTQYLFHALTCKDTQALDAGVYASIKSTFKGGITAGELKRKIEHKDEELEANLSTLLSAVRGTKEYWQRQAGDLAALDEKFGPASLFVTLSCAEYRWNDVRNALIAINSDIEDIEKARIGSLCSLDPVTVTNQFELRFRSFLNEIILDKDGPLGQVEHFYWRLEYQMRGAPHIHMKLWIKDCPILGKETDEKILDWIQKRITCVLPNPQKNPQLSNLVKQYQTHSCTASCRRSVKRSGRWFMQCRFGFPRPATDIAKLNSLSDSVKSRKNGKRIIKLYNLPRKTTETNINDYNPAMLLFWQGNIDIQFCGESSLVLNRYITSYMTKSEKNATQQLFDSISQEKSLRSRLKSVGLRALNQRQTGAYEAAAKLMGTHFHGSSDAVHFLNAAMKQDRKRKLKDYKDLEDLPDNSRATTCTNLIDDYYPNRPDMLENESLYTIATLFEFQRKKPGGEENKSYFQLKHNMGYFRKRTKEKVLKTPHYKPEGDRCEKYFYQLLMLFKPWTNEDDIIGGHATYQDAFLAVSKDLPCMVKFAEARDRIEKATELAEKLQEVQPDRDEPANMVMNDSGINVDVVEQTCSEKFDYHHNDLSAEQLQFKIKQLNGDQRKVFDDIIGQVQHQKHCCDPNCQHQPIRMFVSGVAGTGKSFVIETVTNQIKHMFPEEDKKGIVVAVLAPTGLAAYNVQGQTVHRFLSLPVQHTSKSKHPTYFKMHHDNLKELRGKLKNLKLIIIDEISMVSSVTLAFIHKRLEEIEDITGVAFGNHNLILFGDMLQLRPVNGDFAFKNMTSKDMRTVFKNCGFQVDLWGEFKYMELLQNMRQADDLSYANLLNRVRIGCPTVADIEQLQNRAIDLSGADNLMDKAAKYFVEEMHCQGICLLPLIQQVECFNSNVLKLIGMPIITIPAIDTGHDKVATKGPKVKGKSKKLKTSDTAGLESELTLGVGARIMLKKNLDVESGLVNGVCGEISNIHYDKYGKVISLSVKWDNIDRVLPLKRETAQYEISDNIFATRSQFPISLAYGISIHKSQGLSLDSALLYLGERIFESAMCYVALSRVRQLSQVRIIEFDPLKVTAVKDAVLQYNKLRESIGLELFNKYNCLPSEWEEKKKNRKVGRDKVMAQYPVPKTNFDENLVLQNNNLQVSGDLKYLKLTNNHSNECYANSLIQALLRLDQFCDELGNFSMQNPQNVVCKTLHGFVIGQQNCATMDTALLRMQVDQVIGNQDFFSSMQQHDAQEFLVQIMQHCFPPNLQNLFRFVYFDELTCLTCQTKRTRNNDASEWLSLKLANCGETTTKENFASWIGKNLKATVETNCNICKQSRIHLKVTTVSIPNNLRYLILTIDPFCQLEGQRNFTRSFKQLQGFQASNQRLFNTTFEAVAAIQHQGRSIECGHYKTIGRFGRKWLWLDDDRSVGKLGNFVRNLENIRLLILRKKR